MKDETAPEVYLIAAVFLILLFTCALILVLFSSFVLLGELVLVSLGMGALYCLFQWIEFQ